MNAKKEKLLRGALISSLYLYWEKNIYKPPNNITPVPIKPWGITEIEDVK